MYHIWPTHGQAQFGIGQEPYHPALEGFSPDARRLAHIGEAPVEFLNAVLAGIESVQERKCLAPLERALALSEPRYDAAGLVGERELRQHPFQEQLAHFLGQVPIDRHVGFQRALERLALDREAHILLGRRDPHASAREPASEVWRHRAVRGRDETDEIGDGALLARDDARTHRAFFGARVVAVFPRLRLVHSSPLRAPSRAGICFQAWGAGEGVAVSSAGSAAASGFFSRSSGFSQPAATRACMMMFSASARDNSKPSRTPA